MSQFNPRNTKQEGSSGDSKIHEVFFAVLSQQTSSVNLPFRTKNIYFSVSGLCLCQSSIVSALIGQIKVQYL